MIDPSAEHPRRVFGSAGERSSFFVFEQVHDHAVAGPRGKWPQLVADLRETNVEAILVSFDRKAAIPSSTLRGIPHELRRQLEPMLGLLPPAGGRFIVRGVDELLRTSWAGPRHRRGSSWAEVANRVGFDVPAGVKPSSPFVSMIDPATGTGTFLVEWLRRAKISFQAGQTAGDWREHARDVVLPAMHAFELMLGPYAIAHLKVALELHGEKSMTGLTFSWPTRFRMLRPN